MHRIAYASRQWVRAAAPLRTAASRHYATFGRNAPHKIGHHAAAWTAAAAIGGAMAWQWQSSATVYADAPSTYTGTVEEPQTHVVFPVQLSTANGEWRRLVGLGARQVSVLNINVYVLGLYMRSEDIGRLKQIKGWEQFDKAKFLGSEDMAIALLQQPVDVSIRIVPVRNTNTQHLRDGFTRSLLQRMRLQSQTMTEDEEREIMEAIQEFKRNFPAAKVKRNTEFVFTKTADGKLVMEFEGKVVGTVTSHWLATNFIMGYLTPTAPASELARQDIASGFESLLT